MSIRSYKQIYQKFEDLFPELASRKSGWKGVHFRDRHILIEMKDDTIIHFFYYGDGDWYMYHKPADWKMVKEEKHV